MHKSKMPSQRQLRVGELIRHVLARALIQGDMLDEYLRQHSVTVTEVRVSPDLRQATAYVMPLGGKDQDEVVKRLNQRTYELSHLVAKEMTSKYSPKVRFEIDNSFDHASRIEELLKK